MKLLESLWNSQSQTDILGDISINGLTDYTKIFFVLDAYGFEPENGQKMELILYPLSDQPAPVRPANARRAWMDQTPNSYAYRCLPLAIANQHGWEVFCPFGFTAKWNGGAKVEDVEIIPDGDDFTQKPGSALTNFGSGILTFEMGFMLRSPLGWNIWVSGPVNGVKDGIIGLSGVIETDWSPYTFTMNWRFTRPGEVRFEPGETIAHFFPVRRDLFEHINPIERNIHTDPDTLQHMESWRIGRGRFNENLRIGDPETVAQKWQKHYYRGVYPDGSNGPNDHKIKLRIKPFDTDNDGPN